MRSDSAISLHAEPSLPRIIPFFVCLLLFFVQEIQNAK